jgi:hypothetical protein
LLHPYRGVSLLLLAPLVCVPLALGLVTRSDPELARSVVYRAALRWQLPAAVGLSVSFALTQGPLAVMLALPWLGVATLVALFGVGRMLGRRLLPLGELCIDAGLVFLPVGATWALFARMPTPPVRFEELVILLTAVHFHYAGFSLAILAGLVCRASPSLPARAAAVGVMLGVPAVAIGIAAAPRFEGFAAMWLGAAGLLVGVLQIKAAFGLRPRGAGLLVGLSGVSLLGTMALAEAYGARRWEWFAPPALYDMVRYHGTANAVCVAFAGLFGWSVASASPPGTDAGPSTL